MVVRRLQIAFFFGGQLTCCALEGYIWLFLWGQLTCCAFASAHSECLKPHFTPYDIQHTTYDMCLYMSIWLYRLLLGCFAGVMQVLQALWRCAGAPARVATARCRRCALREVAPEAEGARYGWGATHLEWRYLYDATCLARKRAHAHTCTRAHAIIIMIIIIMITILLIIILIMMIIMISIIMIIIAMIIMSLMIVNSQVSSSSSSSSSSSLCAHPAARRLWPGANIH